MQHRRAILVAAGGAAWEAAVLRQLGSPRSRVVALKRCVDLHDLLATAGAGQASAAVVGDGLPGLDADSVDLLRRRGLGVVVVGERRDLDRGGEERLRRIGVDHVLDSESLERLEEVVVAVAGHEEPPADAARHEPPPLGPDQGPGGRRTLAVWGPTGAPGRTTVAVSLAAELARRGSETLLVDADGYGGAVAQHLGVLDEVSGLLAAVRLANTGQLDCDRLSGVAREVGPGFRVLTGLPRPDRWSEVREAAYATVLELAAALAPTVVLDLGFCLEQDGTATLGASAPQRNAMTLAGLEQADEVLVVGAADPVGLVRLARGLVDLHEAVPGSAVRVVVNRTRSSLGWSHKEIHAMIEGFTAPLGVHFLPEDRGVVDRAMVSGRSVVEQGDGALRRGIAALADAIVGEPVPTRARGRTALAGQAPKSR